MRRPFIHSATTDTGAWATQCTEIISLEEENLKGTLEEEVVILDGDNDLCNNFNYGICHLY